MSEVGIINRMEGILGWELPCMGPWHGIWEYFKKGEQRFSHKHAHSPLGAIQDCVVGFEIVMRSLGV